jgi:hypothetical protein
MSGNADLKNAKLEVDGKTFEFPILVGTEGEKGIDKTNSGEYQIDYIYFFAKENGTWKIYNNEKISDAD